MPDSGRRTPRVLVLCELNVDVILATEQLPEFGQVEQRVADGTITLGSSGAITAAALAALGIDVTVCGTVGDDPIGDLVISMLTDLGVDVTAVIRRPDRRTGMTVVLRRPDGDRAMMTYPGTMADFAVREIPPGVLDSAGHVHISSLFLQTALAVGLPDVLARRRSGVTVSLDPGWDPAQSWEPARTLLPLLDWFLPNANECLAVAGGTGLSVEQAAAALTGTGPTVVVKLGADGALAVAPRTGSMTCVAGQPRIPVDTTGAGDNFDAGFLAAVLSEQEGPGDEDLERALAMGCACGAISTGGVGGVGRLPSRGEAAALAEEILGLTLARNRAGHSHPPSRRPGAVPMSGPAYRCPPEPGVLA